MGFSKILTTKNCVFMARPSPSKLVYVGAKGAFRKNLGYVSQKWVSQNCTKGNLLGRQGVESLKKRQQRR